MDTAGKRPRRLRAKYTTRTNLTICTRGISLLRRACIECSDFPPHIRYREKCSRIFLALLCRLVSAPQRQLHPQLQKTTRGESRNGGERWHGTALSRYQSCLMSREEYPISRTPSGKNTYTPPSLQGKI